MLRYTRILGVVLTTILAGGCTTLADTRNAEGAGKKIVYSKPLEQLWPLAELALQDLGLDVIEKNKTQGYMLAKRNMTAFSYGENIAVFIRNVDSSRTSVEVISKKVLATTVFAPDWTDDIFKRLETRLNK